MIFAFGFSKKYELSLLSIEGRVLDRCRSFDRLASVDAHLWHQPILAWTFLMKVTGLKLHEI